jgi:hypothetical protein
MHCVPVIGRIDLHCTVSVVYQIEQCCVYQQYVSVPVIDRIERRCTLSASLKVLSSEIDPVEICFIRYVVINERGAEISRKIRPSPML